MITVTKRLEFDAGHRLINHQGACRFVHGHRYCVEITVEAPQLNDLGMVVDFSVIKNQVGKWLGEHLDHNILLHSADPLLRYLERTEERRPYVMHNGNPTAENIAVEIYYCTKDLLPQPMKMTRVRVYETPTCYADYEPDDQTETK